MTILDKFKLDDKVAIITGGAQGIGKSITLALAEAGASVAIADLNLDTAEKTANEINEATGQKAIAIEVDVTDPEKVHDMIEEVVDRLGSIDIAVNNAGATINGDSQDMSFEDWNKIINLNLTGVFLCAQAAGKKMIQQGGGSIINIGSMSGHIVNIPQPQASYNASKAGVIHLTKSLAVEWAEKNVRVNSISPGYMATALVNDEDLKPLIGEWEDLTPMKRIGDPEELKGVAVYLASEASTFTTGSDIIVDGGYTLV
ncbi:SDR family oxidoreductase [Marinilactibacillus sp. GCM10026970]|uniref:SDR family oxidoreductase n=1 Tax=Marinilactibacillus sp. GCM10026970 TaxID=3252642 RepID=UPI0036214DC2